MVGVIFGSEHRRGPEQLNYLGRLPDDLLLEMFLSLANEPNRDDAHAVTKIRELNKYWQGWIASIAQLSEKDAALRRNPGIASRLVALCRDVIRGGIAAKDALRQNGPLAEIEETQQFFGFETIRHELSTTLIEASPYHIADLAEAFSQRGGSPTDLMLLEAVALLVASRVGYNMVPIDSLDCTTQPFRRHPTRFISVSHLEERHSWILDVRWITPLARTFSRNPTNFRFVFPLEALAGALGHPRSNLLHQANIGQIATFAEVFGTKDGANFATKVTPFWPSDWPLSITEIVDRFSKRGESVMENIALRMDACPDEVLAHADIDQLDKIRCALIECGRSPSISAVKRIDHFIKNRTV